jgi:putative transcriptional regulator
MPIVRYTPDPDSPYKPTPEEQARIDALTDEEITAAALSDPDNPPFTDDELAAMSAAMTAKRARMNLGLTQEQFAKRFHINYGRLRDIEQGRNSRNDSALLAYLRVIEHDPEAVMRVLSNAA